MAPSSHKRLSRPVWVREQLRAGRPPLTSWVWRMSVPSSFLMRVSRFWGLGEVQYPWIRAWHHTCLASWAHTYQTIVAACLVCEIGRKAFQLHRTLWVESFQTFIECTSSLASMQLWCSALVDCLHREKEQMIAEKSSFWRWPHAGLMPGASRLAHHLHGHKVPLALATSSLRRAFEVKLSGQASAFMRPLFQVREVDNSSQVTHSGSCMVQDQLCFPKLYSAQVSLL